MPNSKKPSINVFFDERSILNTTLFNKLINNILNHKATCLEFPLLNHVMDLSQGFTEDLLETSNISHVINTYIDRQTNNTTSISKNIKDNKYVRITNYSLFFINAAEEIGQYEWVVGFYSLEENSITILDSNPISRFCDNEAALKSLLTRINNYLKQAGIKEEGLATQNFPQALVSNTEVARFVCSEDSYHYMHSAFALLNCVLYQSSYLGELKSNLTSIKGCNDAILSNILYSQFHLLYNGNSFQKEMDKLIRCHIYNLRKHIVSLALKEDLLYDKEPYYIINIQRAKPDKDQRAIHYDTFQLRTLLNNIRLMKAESNIWLQHIINQTPMDRERLVCDEKYYPLFSCSITLLQLILTQDYDIKGDIKLTYDDLLTINYIINNIIIDKKFDAKKQIENLSFFKHNIGSKIIKKELAIKKPTIFEKPNNQIPETPQSSISQILPQQECADNNVPTEPQELNPVEPAKLEDIISHMNNEPSTEPKKLIIPNNTNKQTIERSFQIPIIFFYCAFIAAANYAGYKMQPRLLKLASQISKNPNSTLPVLIFLTSLLSGNLIFNLFSAINENIVNKEAGQNRQLYNKQHNVNGIKAKANNVVGFGWAYRHDMINQDSQKSIGLTSS